MSITRLEDSVPFVAAAWAWREKRARTRARALAARIWARIARGQLWVTQSTDTVVLSAECERLSKPLTGRTQQSPFSHCRICRCLALSREAPKYSNFVCQCADGFFLLQGEPDGLNRHFFQNRNSSHASVRKTPIIPIHQEFFFGLSNTGRN